MAYINFININLDHKKEKKQTKEMLKEKKRKNII